MSKYNYSRFQEEDEEKTIKGTIIITFDFEKSFPKNWSAEEINDYIYDNPDEFCDKPCFVEDLSWRTI